MKNEDAYKKYCPMITQSIENWTSCKGPECAVWEEWPNFKRESRNFDPPVARVDILDSLKAGEIISDLQTNPKAPYPNNIKACSVKIPLPSTEGQCGLITKECVIDA